MTRLFSRRLLAPAATGLGLSLLSVLPAGAHGVADAGLLAGASHPLLGLDHLLLLLGVGGVASVAGAPVLLFAIGGGLLGGVLGAMGGQLPGAELLAALAVSSLGVVLLRSEGSQSSPHGLLGAIVAAAVAVHALLHGQEATAAASWWLGAGLASTAVVGISYGLLRQLHGRCTRLLALGLSLAGVGLALAPLA